VWTAGAARLIRQALVDLAQKGCAILVISQDLDELFAVAHRLAVMHDGRLGVPRAATEWSREKVGLAMMGADSARDAA
jgi:simple sugar transport system ATP-binding protein